MYRILPLFGAVLILSACNVAPSYKAQESIKGESTPVSAIKPESSWSQDTQKRVQSNPRSIDKDTADKIASNLVKKDKKSIKKNEEVRIGKLWRKYRLPRTDGDIESDIAYEISVDGIADILSDAHSSESSPSTTVVIRARDGKVLYAEVK